MSSKIMKFLATPGKLASALDWKKTSGSILSIDIGNERIGLAVASHPSINEPPRQLEPVTMKLETIAQENKKKQHTIAPEIVNELQAIVKENNVCGFIVTWPVQKEGRCGASCGRVLHTLDSLVSNSSSSIFNSNRLFCLWDGDHVTPKEDEWGRNPLYGEPSTKALHIASEEQYKHETSSGTAVDIWNDFCRSQWPELCRSQDEQSLSRNDSSSFKSEFCDSEWLDKYEDTDNYMKVVL